jgi:protein O-mannosyl-transferase
MPFALSRRFFPALQRAALVLVLAAITLAVYAPVKGHPWQVIDDYGYVVDNFHIHYLNWDTVKWSFTTYHYSNWDPLTWLSHAMDWHFFGPDPSRHHETSLLLHVMNVLLLFWLLLEATGFPGRSFAAAALFALHPVNVEAVAWIAERKTVLSMAFFLLTLIAYTWYARRPALSRYVVVMMFSVLALLSKPQVITLPFVLLLWDYWPLGRLAIRYTPFAIRHRASGAGSGEEPIAKSEQRPLGRLLLEKLPFFGLSAASALLTLEAQWMNRTMGALNSYSLASRLGNAIVSYVRYLQNFAWPTHLSFFYPHLQAPLSWQIAGSLLLLLLITLLTLAASGLGSGHRYLIVGWLWFLGTLVPMIQIVQIGTHAMADRYAYLPFIGLYLTVCWGVADWAKRWRSSKVWFPAGVITILLLLMFTTRRQINYWDDDLSLWTHSARAVRNNFMAEELIGETLVRQRQWDDAIGHFRAAASMDPLFPYPRLQIGIYEEDHGHPREAIEQFERVIELTQSAADRVPPLRVAALVHMSVAYSQLGDHAKQDKYMTMAAQESSAAHER